MILASIILVSLAVVLFVSRYRHRDVVKDWSTVLSPEAARIVEQVEANAETDQRMTADAWALAEAAQERAEYQEAIRQLELALWLLEDCTPGRLVKLRAMTVVCRQVAAVLPLPPVRPSSFKLTRVRSLAGLGAILHAILVTPAERMALRARVLVAVFRLLVWTLRRAKAVAAERPDRGRAWRRFEAAMGDYWTADRECSASYRACMVTLSEYLRREGVA